MTEQPATRSPIHASARFGSNVRLGQNVTIEADVVIGDNCIIDSNVYIGRCTVIGNDCHFYTGAAVGTDPQDLGYNDRETSRTRIGNGVHIREYATVHRATGINTETVVGDRCFLMAYSHVGHNCKLSDDVILANNVHLGGHVEIGEFSNIGGMVVVHQFVRIGRMVMVGGFGAIRQDLPPFALAEGVKVGLKGINTMGIRRRGMSLSERSTIKEAYKLLWFQGLTQTNAIGQIRERFPDEPLVAELLDFVQSSKRGIRKPGRASELSSPA